MITSVGIGSGPLVPPSGAGFSRQPGPSGIGVVGDCSVCTSPDSLSMPSVTLPAAVAAIESRVNILSKSKKLPANLDAATFESVKTGLADAKTLWDQATTAQASGNVEAAVTAARQVKEKADAALAALGMTAG